LFQYAEHQIPIPMDSALQSLLHKPHKRKQPSFISNYLQVLAIKKTGMLQGAIKWRPEF
jgi:hypothetical protein